MTLAELILLQRDLQSQQIPRRQLTFEQVLSQVPLPGLLIPSAVQTSPVITLRTLLVARLHNFFQRAENREGDFMGKTAQPIKTPFIRTRATLPKWPSVEARDTSLAMFSPKGLSLWWRLSGPGGVAAALRSPFVPHASTCTDDVIILTSDVIVICTFIAGSLGKFQEAQAFFRKFCTARRRVIPPCIQHMYVTKESQVTAFTLYKKLNPRRQQITTFLQRGLPVYRL